MDNRETDLQPEDARHEQARYYNVGAIRALLIEAFTVRDLWRFCLDRSHFTPVLHSLPHNASLIDTADLLLHYCQARNLLVELLAALAEYNQPVFETHRPFLHRLPEETGEDSLTSLLTRAARLRQRREFAESVALLRTARRGDPTNRQIENALIETLWDWAAQLYVQRDLHAARRVLLDMRSIDPYNPHVTRLEELLGDVEHRIAQAAVPAAGARPLVPGAPTMYGGEFLEAWDAPPRRRSRLPLILGLAILVIAVILIILILIAVPSL